MTENTKNNKPLASKRVVGGLLIANVVAFLFTALFFSTKTDNSLENKATAATNTIEYVKQGWQVMHWAYSVTELFSNND